MDIFRQHEIFEIRDFKVKLGSILEAEFREYYITRRFSYLKERLSSAFHTLIKKMPAKNSMIFSEAWVYEPEPNIL